MINVGLSINPSTSVLSMGGRRPLFITMIDKQDNEDNAKGVERSI